MLERPPAPPACTAAPGDELHPWAGRVLRGAQALLADDLMHALVAESELVCNLPQRPALGMQAADRVLVVDARAVLLMLELEQLLAQPLRLTEDLLVQRHHAV